MKLYFDSVCGKQCLTGDTQVCYILAYKNIKGHFPTCSHMDSRSHIVIEYIFTFLKCCDLLFTFQW